MTRAEAAIVFTCCAMLATSAFAEPPRTINATLVSTPATPDLTGSINGIVKQEIEPAWMAYSVARLRRDDGGRQDDWNELCRREAGPVKLEPSPAILVLFRIQNGAIQRIRTVSSDCAVDAGGLKFYWLEPVNAAQSVAFLRSFVRPPDLQRLQDAAINTIALHEDRSASSVLLDLAKNSTEPRVRQRALVAVARRADAQAAAAITSAIDQDPDTEVKKQAVFALSQLPKDEGIPLLIRLARTSTIPIVRKQAIFWLGQSRDPRAIAYFEEVLK